MADVAADPGAKRVPVCTEVGLRDFSKTPALIEKARDQTLRFLDWEPCASCRHAEPAREKGAPHGRAAVSALRAAVPARERAS